MSKVPSTDEALLALVDQGLNFAEIAKRWGVSRGSVAGRVFRLRERGVTVPVITAKLRQALARQRLANWMADHGGSVDEAAAALGISLSHARMVWRQICNQLGWQAS